MCLFYLRLGLPCGLFLFALLAELCVRICSTYDTVCGRPAGRQLRHHPFQTPAFQAANAFCFWETPVQQRPTDVQHTEVQRRRRITVARRLRKNLTDLPIRFNM
jgi:hypothetical protein